MAASLKDQFNTRWLQNWSDNFCLCFKNINKQKSDQAFCESVKPLRKRLSFRPLTTRRYYPGRHKIQLIINGEIKHQAWFEVKSLC
ncbi:hypothetical protein P8S54_09820 [Thiomicrospira sp. R3]|uniref:hypothetical protein n=1 Tax=Thiomicrospira sp. R3 TaxID=3035472 RepID=UPI00259B116F|nr:hypothetical protein [Thiomicrospira sp. R3]WFE68493.1 hypothetical protein P8S54_09820 [Thiomicrospira sp. R3]